MTEGKYTKQITGSSSALNSINKTNMGEINIYEKDVNLEDETPHDANKTGAVQGVFIELTNVKEPDEENDITEESQYLDNRSEHTGEEQVDIGLKDLPLTGAPNIYVGKRNFIHQLMDVALLMANVSQLKALLSIDSSDKYFYPLLVFIILSITLQVVFTVTMLLIWSIEKGLEERTIKAHTSISSDRDSVFDEQELKEVDKKKKLLADRLDKLGNILVLSIIVSNVFITGFGVEPHGEENG